MSENLIGRPKQARAQSTIDVLVAETNRAIATGGESAVRIQDISAITGVSIGSIYHHFGDRDGLIRATLVRQYADQIRTDVPRVKDFMLKVQSTADLTAQYDAMLAFAKEHFVQQSALARVAVLGHTVGRPVLLAELSEVQHELTESATEVMELLAERGILKPHLTPRAAAMIWLGLLFGRAVAELDTQPINEHEWATAMLSAFGGLFVGSDN